MQVCRYLAYRLSSAKDTGRRLGTSRASSSSKSCERTSSSGSGRPPRRPQLQPPRPLAPARGCSPWCPRTTHRGRPRAPRPAAAAPWAPCCCPGRAASRRTRRSRCRRCRAAGTGRRPSPWSWASWRPSRNFFQKGSLSPSLLSRFSSPKFFISDDFLNHKLLSFFSPSCF